MCGCAPTIEEPRVRAWPATQPFNVMPRANVAIDLRSERGALESFRQSIGIGGVSPIPPTGRMIEGARKLKPRLTRIFIQEFFEIYPEHGRFDWAKLDRYMDAQDKTGTKVVAAIAIKPKPLYPKVDEKIWRPSDVAEWQRVISALVKRYSVDRKLVTYWEIGNETDIGEVGGCPYRMSPEEYLEYYKFTTEPILKAFPGAKIGGCAVADSRGDYLPQFVRLCGEQKVRLDFISWHLYCDDPREQVRLAEKYAKLANEFPGKRPELLLTEWSSDFEPVSVQEQSQESRRAAITAATAMDLMDARDARVDWTFYYHLNDQVAKWDDFAPFFRDPRIMYHHWNEVPHRFALFDLSGEVRPQYFVFQMLSRMPATRVQGRSDQKDLRVIASKDAHRVAAMLCNYALGGSRNQIATVGFSNLTVGRKRLIVYRIDRAAAWSSKRLELIATEDRAFDSRESFACQVYCPGDSVTMVVVEDMR